MNKSGLNYKGHLIVSIAVLFLFLMLNTALDLFSYTLISLITLLFVVLIYGLLPDIDTTESKIGKIFLLLSLFAIAYGIIFNKNLFSLIILLILGFFILIKHRSFTHSILSAFIFSLPLYFIGIDYFAAAFLSYVGHLLADGKVRLFSFKI